MPPAPPLRIAMWSGPRNLSTAMMRAFGNRSECAVIDEPFYAAYLAATGLQHPMREEILAAQPTDAADVVARLLGPVPGGKPIFYQKHMAHHMQPGFATGWMAQCRSAFLIRQPARVLASYRVRRDDVSLDALGYQKQAALFDEVCDRDGHAPPIIDADDLRAHPCAVLAALCQALQIPFDPAMLAWPPGPRATDGVWAPAWYDAVLQSTGFPACHAAAAPAALGPSLQPIADAAQPLYDRLYRYRLRAMA